MEQPTFLQILLIFISIGFNFRQVNTLGNSSKPPLPESTLDLKQLKALQSLNIPTSTDPCSNPPVLHNATKCDTQKPFRHLISLRLINCSDDVSLSFTALKSLSTLQELTFINCPTPAIRFPADLSLNLRTFSCVNSLGKLTGVWLSRLENITDLTVISVPIKASGLYVILGNLNKLNKLTLSYANITGFLPKTWHSEITHIDLSYNQIKGKISSSITELENLLSLDLSANMLTDIIPRSIGNLISLKNLSLASNTLSGSIPESMASMPDLEYIDLSSNQLNGTIPSFLANINGLKHLNLEKNNFQGVMPFNMSFIKKLSVFKIGENSNLCYNHSSFGTSSKVKLGVAACDKNGFPVSPPTSPGPSGGDMGDSGDEDGDLQDETSDKGGGHHGPNKVVLGIAIALSSIVFLILFLIFLARKCV